MVETDGLEPPTPASSGLRSTLELRFRKNSQSASSPFATRMLTVFAKSLPCLKWVAPNGCWYGIRGSNPCQEFGRLLCCHYTNPVRGTNGWDRTNDHQLIGLALYQLSYVSITWLQGRDLNPPSQGYEPCCVTRSSLQY
jgi:hypothetical protein